MKHIKTLFKIILLTICTFMSFTVFGKQVTNYYDIELNVISANNTDKIKYYCIYEINDVDTIIDFVRYYDYTNNRLLWKYNAFKVSNVFMLNDIVDGEHFIYDSSENIKRKIIHINPKKLELGQFMTTNNDEIFDFDTAGYLIKYTKFKNGEENIIVNYDSNQNIKNAKSNDDLFFYQGNPTSGYELIY